MSDWGRLVRLAEVSRGPLRLILEPDDAARTEIARRLGLVSLPTLKAEIILRPWLDGAEITGRFKGRVEQVCGVTLDPFEQDVEGEIAVAVVPAGSPNAQDEDRLEVELDLDAPDPPDVLESDEIDVGAYLVEHLSLEIDPFPRKPGAEFVYKDDAPDEGPFAALRKLKDQS